MLAARADLPLPGAPAKSVSLARAIRPGQIQWIAADLVSLPRVISGMGAVLTAAGWAMAGMVILSGRGIGCDNFHNHANNILLMRKQEQNENIIAKKRSWLKARLSYRPSEDPVRFASADCRIVKVRDPQMDISVLKGEANVEPFHWT